MNGYVDEYGRSLIPVPIAAAAGAPQQSFEVWIDTGCTGELVLPRSLIQSLSLVSHGAVQVRLANGAEQLTETFLCDLEWFGERRTVEVVANDSFPLLGVGLLLGRILTVDYSSLTLSVTSP